MHRTLEAVHQRSQSVVEAATTAPEEASHQGCSTSSEHEPTTAELRNAVNTKWVCCCAHSVHAKEAYCSVHL